MRIYITILLLCNFFLGFGQEYEFNLLTKYSSIHMGEVLERVVYSNKENPMYFLSLRKTEETNLAHLSDIENEVVHYFSFNEIIEDENIFFTFNYIRTEKLKHSPYHKTAVFDFETIHQDSLYKTVKMTLYENKSKKKIVNVRELKIKKHDYNLFPLYRYSKMHLFEYRTDIDFGETGLIESTKSIGETKNYETQLDFYKEVSLFIKV